MKFLTNTLELTFFQYLHFVVKDQDLLSRDDDIGEAIMDVDDLIIGHNGRKEMSLGPNGAMIIAHVDNIPKAVIDKLRGPSAPTSLKSTYL